MDWSKQYQYNFPTTIYFGKGVLDNLPSFLKEKDLLRPLLVTDPQLPSLPFFANLLDHLKSKGLEPEIFSGVDKNPIKKNVLDGVETFHNHKADAIIGIGGGASMDVARAMVLKAYHEEDLFLFEDGLGNEHLVKNTIPYFITIPTTSGTGSEVGRSAVISDDITHEKKILFSPRLMASAVFADPETTMNLPAPITAATGIDAFTHNLEAYFSKGFHPLCDGIALEGIKLTVESLEKATLNPCLESRTKMMATALMGATAFQKGLGIVHSLAHPLSTLHDMHHGLANGVMISYGTKFNLPVVEEKILHLYNVLGIKGYSTQDFPKWLRGFNEKLNLPNSLKALNIPPESAERLSELAFNDVCHQCNPRPVTQKDFLKIYQEALEC